MKRLVFIIFILMFLSGSLWGLNKYRGANFVSFGDKDELKSSKALNSVYSLKQASLNTLTIPVTWFQNSVSDNIMYVKTNGSWQTPSDEALKELLDYAKELNLTTVIKIHINITNEVPRTEIEPSDFNTWWDNYRNFILKYAEICKEKKVDIFLIGTETKKVVTSAYNNYWKILVNDVRKIFSGLISYSANWDNIENISFWSEFDLIGIDAYFPLLPKNDTTIDEIKQAWEFCAVVGPYYGRSWLQDLRTYSVAYNKNIIFTEIGYCSARTNDLYSSVLAQPWGQPKQAVDMEIQSKAYAGFIETFLKEDWFEGFFIWDWRTDPDAGGCNDKDFTPQNKPALEVLKSLKYYDEDIKKEDLEIIKRPEKINYKNNDAIVFQLVAHTPGDLTLRIYDKNYSRVYEKKQSLQDEEAINISINFNDLKSKITRGLYFYKIEFNNFEEKGRFIIIK